MKISRQSDDNSGSGQKKKNIPQKVKLKKKINAFEKKKKSIPVFTFKFMLIDTTKQMSQWSICKCNLKSSKKWL